MLLKALLRRRGHWLKHSEATRSCEVHLRVIEATMGWDAAEGVGSHKVPEAAKLWSTRRWVHCLNAPHAFKNTGCNGTCSVNIMDQTGSWKYKLQLNELHFFGSSFLYYFIFCSICRLSAEA